ncbi:AAA family ATPase [Microbulbifer aggregans]|uniref:AAA family ATPase n=1 Tax=Microbulbifer aggregans TaxID=1769779 RepID=UPI001CFD7021|nr:AAA family ATPase [Microbulbifer aggregans]
MDKRNPPILHLLAGINGAGKTTFYYNHIKPRAKVPFINADEIQKQLWPEEANNPQRSYEAAKIAEKQRAEHIKQGKPFAAETVFSHPSKLDLIRDAQQGGFMVALYHIHVATPELAKSRVDTRTQMGGHDVPEDKIYSRFSRTLAHLQDAVQMADRTMVFDNSVAGKTHRHLMTLERGRVVSLKADLPDWAGEQYGREIKIFQIMNSGKDVDLSASVKPGKIFGGEEEALKKIQEKELQEMQEKIKKSPKR